MQTDNRINIATLIPDERIQKGWIGVIANDHMIYKWFINKLSDIAERNVARYFIYINHFEELRGRTFSKIIRLNNSRLPRSINCDDIDYLERKWNIKLEEIDTNDLIIK